MSATYGMVWVSLEIIHDMQEGDVAHCRAYVDARLAEGDIDARLAVVEFVDACHIAELPVDPAYEDV
jgi:hypothetical protein